MTKKLKKQIENKLETLQQLLEEISAHSIDPNDIKPYAILN